MPKVKKDAKPTARILPRFQEARDILERFRNAGTEREKIKVINTIKQKYPQIAERMALLLSS